jgi:hypothetical protein
MSATIATHPGIAGIDPRGPRVSAALTSVVLALALLAPPRAALVLLAAQGVVFALGTFRGIQHTPYALVFRGLVRPRLGAPGGLEDPRPPRFAQALGLGFVAVAVVALLAGLTTVGLVAAGLALVAALLNAAFGLCLGCELYLIVRRAIAR